MKGRCNKLCAVLKINAFARVLIIIIDSSLAALSLRVFLELKLTLNRVLS